MPQNGKTTLAMSEVPLIGGSLGQGIPDVDARARPTERLLSHSINFNDFIPIH